MTKARYFALRWPKTTERNSAEARIRERSPGNGEGKFVATYN